MHRNRVSVLLPALDEELTIGQVIDDIPKAQLKAMGYNVEVMVVDGHSTDDTRKIAREKGARLIIQEGRGKGLGVRKAFEEFNGKYLFMMDADGTYPPHHILDMMPLLETDNYDVVLGSRLSGNIMPGAMSRLNHFGNKVLTGTANLFFPNGHKLTDVCTGMWGFRGEVVKQLSLTAQHFEVEAEMYAKCIKSGYRVGEVPIEYRKRKTLPKLRSLKHGSKIFHHLLTEKFFS